MENPMTQSWTPTLVADITLILGSARIKHRGPRLEWYNSSDQPEVSLEPGKLLLNSDRYRSRIEQLALKGVAAHHGIEIGEWS
jgi:hypothetical protein